MKDIKNKTINGLTWSFIDNFLKLSITFLVGIILARLLTPAEFGLIGMTTIFIAVSQTIIDSGFSQALIRKKQCSQADYSTAFIFNILIGFLLFLLLFFIAGSISIFFDEPQLKLLIRVLSIGLIINSFNIVQIAILTKNINFKVQTKISVISSILSGVIGISMAYMGYGVWSLVIKTLVGYLCTTILFWMFNNWKPTLEFNLISFNEMFSFGSRLLLSGLIDTIYRNIYLLIIGKFFSATELGYYTRADQFANLPSKNITGVIQRVSYPVLSSLQNEKQHFLSAVRKLIKSTMFISFFLMMGLAALAKILVITLVGTKWVPAVIYLQLLCFVGMLYPLHAINLNILNVKGRSDLFLNLEIIKKILAIPLVILGIFYGIKILIIGMLVHSIISLYINTYWTKKIIGYSFLQQIIDIIPSFSLAVFISFFLYILGFYITTSSVLKLSILLFTAIILTFGINEIIKLKEYIFIRKIIVDKIRFKF